MIAYRDDERVQFDEYLDFLRRTDLGSQYPSKNFEARLKVALENFDVEVTARNEAGKLVGICFGLTDWAYFLFLTDLGVDRDYLRRGIGRELVQRAIARVGGADDITTSTISNHDAIGFYAAIGMKNEPELVVQYCRDWDDFTVE